MIAPSCSLLHFPCDLEHETNETSLPAEAKRWMAFARQKLDEVVVLAGLATAETYQQYAKKLMQNVTEIESRRRSPLIHKPRIKDRVAVIGESDMIRRSPFAVRRQKQRAVLKLPLFPTTTIGSFPQTDEVRKLRAKFKKGELGREQYETQIKAEIDKAIRWQESIGMDVLVHGEFERNDMVEYFGELLEGFVFTRNGWVQSYGSRCAKPIGKRILNGPLQRSSWLHAASPIKHKFIPICAIRDSTTSSGTLPIWMPT